MARISENYLRLDIGTFEYQIGVLGDTHMASDQIQELFTIAAREPSGGPRVRLFRALDGKELFYSATPDSTSGQARMSTSLRKLDDGSLAMLTYTSKRHPDLPQRFAGAQWLDLLKVAYEALHADWLVIINLKNETVAIAREQIPVIIADLEGSRAGAPSESLTSNELENAISNSVGKDSEDWFESVLLQLRGRELYLELTGDASPGEQPTIRTSVGSGRGDWILAFTTRKRQGINYAGITWENLVEMVKANTALSGVQVVNDADDWIVLGRDVI